MRWYERTLFGDNPHSIRIYGHLGHVYHGGMCSQRGDSSPACVGKSMSCALVDDTRSYLLPSALLRTSCPPLNNLHHNFPCCLLDVGPDKQFGLTSAGNVRMYVRQEATGSGRVMSPSKITDVLSSGSLPLCTVRGGSSVARIACV